MPETSRVMVGHQAVWASGPPHRDHGGFSEAARSSE